MPDITIAITDTFYFPTMSQLDENEQEIAALWKLFVDINTGEFIQFFCNGILVFMLRHAWIKANGKYQLL